MTMPSRFPAGLRSLTPARIGLATNDGTARTEDVLDFQHAYALARDAIQVPLDAEALVRSAQPGPALIVRSRAPDRSTYLRRPDLGRRLHQYCISLIPKADCDVVFVIADGLSSRAVEHHAIAVLQATLERLHGWSVGPVVVATQARVAIGDEIGACLGAAYSVVLIGERPGLTVSDSLGAYITCSPSVGRMDSERNCISNIHQNGGLSPVQAARKLVWLLEQARKLGCTGIDLKDDMTDELLDAEVGGYLGKVAPDARECAELLSGISSECE